MKPMLMIFLRHLYPQTCHLLLSVKFKLLIFDFKNRVTLRIILYPTYLIIEYVTVIKVMNHWI